MDKLIYVGFVVLESSKILLYGTNFDELQPCFVEKDTIASYG